MACRTITSSEPLSRPSPSTTPLAQVHDLLVSLLLWWPYEPHQQSPSILLCGPASNGKSHLVRRVVDAANHQSSPYRTGKPELLAQECRRRVVLVTPRFAAAVTVQNVKDGCTGLRRLLRSTVQEVCVDTLRELKAKTPTEDNAEPSELSVLLVLDHVECYLTFDESYMSGGGMAGGFSAVAFDSNNNGGDGATPSPSSANPNCTFNTQYPALLADLYTVLRSSPPLFSQTECAALRLSTLVYVSLFTGELGEVLPIVRERYVDYELSLPTPAEAERRAFFHLYTLPSPTVMDVPPAGLQLPAPLADALVLRTGGVSYGGLQEIVMLALDHLESVASSVPSSPSLTSVTVSSDAKKWDPLTAGAAAQSILHAYQASGSVTALEYRHSAGYIDVQVTHWDDIAGMEDIKATLRRLVTDPIHHRDAYRSFHVRPSTGVLLYGPPGTGKTMLAKAMATELNASFVYMDLPELVQSEVGESERHLQAYFDVARERSPSLVFMDEVQAAFGLRYGDTNALTQSYARAGVSSTGGAEGSSNTTATTSHDARLVSHLLRLLDAAQQDEEHFVLFVGATNAVHLLDPLLLRAGRLDTLLEVPLPDAAARRNLIKRVVYGEWANWFDTKSGSTGSTVSAASGVQYASALIQPALVEKFVQLSDGFSGAQVRNFLSVFGLQLAHTVGRFQHDEEGQMKNALSEYDSTREDDVRREVNQRQRCLQSAITSFLFDNNSSEVLSRAALDLIRSSHDKSLA